MSDTNSFRDLGVYTFPAESGLWIAACANPDLVVQGRTEAEAMTVFQEAIAFVVLYHFTEGRALFTSRPIDHDKVAEWSERHAKAHPEKV